MPEDTILEPEDGNQEEVELEEEELEPQDQDIDQDDDDPQAEKPFYTVEEMKGLDPDEVDSSRIPAELLPFFKSMQAGYGKKFQKLADERRKLREEVEAKEGALQPKNVYEAYDRDPDGVISYINSEIKKAKKDLNDEQVDRLLEVKDSLREYGLNQIRLQQKAGTSINEAIEELKRTVPNYDSVKSDLNDFAMGLLPGDEEESSEALRLLTNPGAVVRVGKKEYPMPAIWFTRAMYAQFSKSKPIKKKARKIPTEVVPPGTGQVGKAVTKKSVEALYKKASDSGDAMDWANYMTAKQNHEAALAKTK